MTVPMQRPTHFSAPAHGLDGETSANGDGSVVAQAGRRPPTERVLRKRGATWLPRRAQKKDAGAKRIRRRVRRSLITACLQAPVVPCRFVGRRWPPGSRPQRTCGPSISELVARPFRGSCEFAHPAEPWSPRSAFPGPVCCHGPCRPSAERWLFLLLSG